MSTTSSTARRGGARPVDPAAPWAGPNRRYDIIKEGLVALLVVGLLAIGLAAVFSSPDDKSVTLAQWAKADPADFVTTATMELDGTSTSASYGAPYNTNGDGASLGPLKLQKWAGVRVPVNSAQQMVVDPLKTSFDPAVQTALATWQAASADQQLKWATNYDTAISKAPGNDPTKVSSGDYGPVPAMTAGLLELAKTGALDGILATGGAFYQTNYTVSLLFLADGGYLGALGDANHLGGDQWGMMNEMGSWPGQAWLWLYTFWYQVPPFSSSGNADALVWGLMMLLTLGLVLVPFIPGVRDLPRLIPIHRLVWRDYYSRYGSTRS